MFKTQRRPSVPRPAFSWNDLSTSWDLVALAALALLLPALMFVPWALPRLPFGLIAVAFAPGYALMALIFPGRHDLDRLGRSALSIAVSLAVPTVLALLFDRLPWGIQPWPIVISLSLWLLVVPPLAAIRRARLLATGEAYLPPSLDIVVDHAAAVGRPGPARWVAALMAVAVLLWSLSVFVAPTLSSRLTEFYIVNADNLAEDYPRSVAVGEPLPVEIGVTNRESTTITYTIDIQIDGQSMRQIAPFSLDNGQTATYPLDVGFPNAGPDQAIDILLFVDGQPEPYRQLRLWVNVESP